MKQSSPRLRSRVPIRCNEKGAHIVFFPLFLKVFGGTPIWFAWHWHERSWYFHGIASSNGNATAQPLPFHESPGHNNNLNQPVGCPVGLWDAPSNNIFSMGNPMSISISPWHITPDVQWEIPWRAMGCPMDVHNMSDGKQP